MIERINRSCREELLNPYIFNMLQQGDILFFYASQNSKAIEPVGILETIEIVDNFDDLWKMVKNKTVFSQTDLQKMLDEKGKLNVRSEEHTSELQSRGHLVCRLLLEK